MIYIKDGDRNVLSEVQDKRKELWNIEMEKFRGI